MVAQHNRNRRNKKNDRITRKELLGLVQKTIVYKYDLPNASLGIEKTIFSTDNDKCYSATNNNDLAEIIYNSVIEYSFNEFEIY